MLSASAVLVSSDPNFCESCRQVVEAIPRLRLTVVRQPEEAEALLASPHVALLLAHVRTKTDGKWVTELLQRAVASGHPVPTVVLCDRAFPDLALALLRQGAADCLSRPLDLNRLGLLVEMLTLRACCAAAARPAPSAVDLLEGEAPSMRRLLEQVLRVAARDTAILLGGETGTGKTRLARLIHEHSPRADQPFLVVNCGALATNLIESEMFGHVRGAFTGADRDRIGKFAEVGGGTLLLDEVDSLPPSLQAKLLRVIGEKVFEPVGSNQSQPVRARIIAATNRDLEQEVAEGRFRADLYYRLNVVGFCLPPLRERLQTVGRLARAFVEEFAHNHRRPVPAIDSAALEALQSYSWPGNVRELRNVMERAVVLCPGDTITLEDLPESLVGAKNPVPAALPLPEIVDDALPVTLRNVRSQAEFHRIRDALHRNKNNRVRAAAELGISRMTLYNKIHKYGLTRPSDLIETPEGS
jgi:DNA-binding NtrC family response regulator